MAAVAFGLFAWQANSARAGVFVKFTVNSSLDVGDDNPGDAVCDTITGSPVVCTLRAAIEEANALNGPNVINFTATNVVLTSDLPDVTERVTIDASANPDGFSIDAAGFGADAVLVLGSDADSTSSLSIIRGLNIFGGISDGIEINGLGGVPTVAVVTIGGDPSAGDAPAGEGNIIHDNGEDGIEVDTGSLGGHVIEGNRIGTSPLGLDADGNVSDGISISGGTGAAGDITIGGFPNLISANGDDGVDFSGGTADVLIQDNWFGLDVTGSASDPFANLGDGVVTDNSDAVATIMDNTIAGGGIDPTNNPGSNAIELDTAGNTVLGNCLGFNSTCAGSAGGFIDECIEIDESDPGGNTVGDGTDAGRNIIGNCWLEGVGISGADNAVTGNYIGFGDDGEESGTIFDDCVELSGDDNEVMDNLLGNCGFTGGFNGVDISGGGNVVQGNDMGRGTNTATADTIDGPCVYISGDGNQVLTNVMVNCDSGTLDSSVELSSGSGNVVQGNDITSPLGEDAIDIEGGGIDNRVASQTLRMVGQGTGDLPIDIDDNGVTVNDSGDGDAGTNLYHNYPVFAPTSSVPGCAVGSAGPFDHVRIYTISTAAGVTTYDLVGEGDTDLAGDFEICIGNTSDATVVGTSTVTIASTTDGLGPNSTSEFSVTEQDVAAGATPTNTAPPPTDTPVPTTPTPATNTPPPPTNTPPPPPTATPTSAKPCGDVNDNGSVDSVDALLILQLSAGLVQTLPNLPSADVNDSGSVNAIDAQLILQVEAGLIGLGELNCG